MSEVLDFFTQIKNFASDYPNWILYGGIMVVLIFTQIAKLPVKYFTGKIQNEKLRKKINVVIMLLPIAFGFLLSWILTFFGFSFSVSIAVVWGTISQTIYEFISRIIRRIKNGEDITTETVKSDLTESVKEAQTAEDKFNELVKEINSKKDEK